jgi:hypothetical protein
VAPAKKAAAKKAPAKKAAAKKAPAKKAAAKKAPAKKAAAKKAPAKKDAAKGLCFVISPFGGWFDAYYKQVFEPAIRKAKLAPHRADDLYRPTSIVQDIWEYVEKADVVLADLTGKNPNVMYELGLAHATNTPVVMVVQDLADVPFDLRSMRVITYQVADPKWAETLTVDVAQALSEVLSAPETAIYRPFSEVTKTSPGPVPEGPSAEIQLLERRVNRLEARSVSRPRDMNRRLAGRSLAADEAIELTRSLVQAGVPDLDIVDIVSAQGPPRSWVRDVISETGSRNQGRLELR